MVLALKFEKDEVNDFYDIKNNTEEKKLISEKRRYKILYRIL